MKTKFMQSDTMIKKISGSSACFPQRLNKSLLIIKWCTRLEKNSTVKHAQAWGSARTGDLLRKRCTRVEKGSTITHALAQAWAGMGDSLGRGMLGYEELHG